MEVYNMKNKLPIDTIFTLLKRECVVSQFDFDKLANHFAKHVKDTLSNEAVELAFSFYLSSAKHNDIRHRNEILRNVVRFVNQYGWEIPEYHQYYYKKYSQLFGYLPSH